MKRNILICVLVFSVLGMIYVLCAIFVAEERMLSYNTLFDSYGVQYRSDLIPWFNVSYYRDFHPTFGSYLRRIFVFNFIPLLVLGVASGIMLLMSKDKKSKQFPACPPPMSNNSNWKY